MKMLQAIILGVATTALLLCAAPPVPAATFNLSATAGVVTMPDGVSVPVWGLVDSDQPGTTPLTPVPVLTVAAGDDLTIHLSNELPEPVSLVINGQPLADPVAPEFFTDLNGRRRVRSFMHEAPAPATPIAAPGTADYRWGALKPGTYLIASGSHPSVQVPMGLYAILKVEDAAGSNGAYDPDNFTAEAVLLFSEIDPALNQAVTDGIYGDPAGAYPTALKVGYRPKYFLLNGRPWSTGTPPLATVTAGETVLLRMFNAGLRPRTPIFPGLALTMIAEDGNPGNYQPTQSTADLVAGKTLDALVTIPVETSAGYLPMHDRMLGLAGGGMVGYLAVNDGRQPVALDVTVIGSGSVSAASLPGGITSCAATGGICTAEYLPGTTLTLYATPSAPANALSSWSVTPSSGGGPTGECSGSGDCVVTLDQAKTVTATFATFTDTTLTSPNGGETIPLDATVPIRWVAPAGAYTFDLGYSNGPGSPFRLIANRVGGREFLWNLAVAGLHPSSGVRLAIVSYDAGGNVLERDISDAPFSLVSPIALSSPNGGEAIAAGSSHAITWNLRPTTPSTFRASLWYQSAPTLPWTLIADVNPALGSYAWSVPTALISTARVAITIYDRAGKAIATDTSDAPFSIVSSPTPAALATPGGVSRNSITPIATASATASASVSPSVADTPETGLRLLFPGGGEVLPVETPVTVIWQSPAAVSFILDYSLDAGQNWKGLAKDLEDTQFDWQIDPELRGSNSVLLRVTALGAEGEVIARDHSDDEFSID